MTRRRSVVIVVGAIALTAAGGFVAGSRITSPAEIASRTASPSPSPILVPVEERLLSTEVVTRGTGRFGSPQKLSVPTSALKPSAGIVAALPLAGAEIIEGQVVANASGEVLEVALPDDSALTPGESYDWAVRPAADAEVADWPKSCVRFSVVEKDRFAAVMQDATRSGQQDVDTLLCAAAFAAAIVWASASTVMPACCIIGTI